MVDGEGIGVEMRMRAMVLGSWMVVVSSVCLGDSNFTNGQDDFQWGTSGNWNNEPTRDQWVYVNNGGIGGGHLKTSEETPCVLNLPGVVTEVQNLHLGWGNDDGGWLDVRSDLSVLMNTTLGRGTGSTGWLRISGGTTTYGRTLLCGLQAGAQGTIVVDGGELICSPTPDYPLKLGENGSGVLRVVSGRLQADYDVTVGNNPSAVALMEVLGGEVYVGRNVSHWMSDATYRQRGGRVVVKNFLTMGSGVQNGVPSQGHFEMSGGELIVSNKMFVSQNGSCGLDISGGAIWVGNGGIVMGMNAASVVTGVLDGAETTLTTTGEIYLSGAIGTHADFVQRAGILTAPILNIASISNAVGSYMMEGGELRVSNRLRVGRAGEGLFEQRGGEVAVSTLEVGSTSRDNNCFDARQPECVYRMTGGTLSVERGLQVGYSGGNGRLELLGGTCDVASQVFVGYYPYLATGTPAKGELIVGGEASACFQNEVMIGHVNAAVAKGALHLCGGGSGTAEFRSNVHFRNEAQLKVTVDGQGVNPAAVDAYVWLHDSVSVVPASTKDAQPGQYEVMHWRTLVRDAETCNFALAPEVDPALWGLDVDEVGKKLYLIKKAAYTVLYLR